MAKVTESYGADSIQVLEGLEPVRKRPGMYIGSTDERGLHHLVWEIVDNSIDEAMAGHCDTITITLCEDGACMVEDNGRGIPVEKHKKTGKSTLETILTVLHAGGKFGGGGYKVSGGLHGVGASVVNALSSKMEARVHRDGKIYYQAFSLGKTDGDVEVVGKSDHTGTIIKFYPDESIFKISTKFDYKTIKNRLRQQAYLTKGITLFLNDERSGERYKYYFEGGVKSYVTFLNKNEDTIGDIFYVEKEAKNVLVEVSMQYNREFSNNIIAFVNNIHTPEGGAHLIGFRMALTRTINKYARSKGILKEKDQNLTNDDVVEGLTCVISVKLEDPQFEGQTKGKLGSAEAKGATDSVMATGFMEFLEEDPVTARKIIEKVFLAAKARLAARAARDTVIRKGALEGMTLPGKLSDCSSKDPYVSELYIVEGDSAGGSAKQGRDRKTQAILPLKGKILNTEQARIDKIFANQEIKNMIIALGTSIGETFDISKLRYHRIIIMTDADVDGAHIRTLLLTFFFRYLKKIIELGYLYIALPPLYKLSKGKKSWYVYDEENKEKIMKEYSITGENIQRYKGLGEMNPDQLWETTMDPEKRKMYKVKIDDAQAADEIFKILMGADVPPRRRFIQSRAKDVQNLDI
ncbi:MAG: DNA topoisomerase (ATP-hydrolyzing) subunit B [Candidatus Gracilibacteria bacterium]